MKRKFTLWLSIVLAIFMIFAMACQGEDDDDASSGNDDANDDDANDDDANDDANDDSGDDDLDDDLDDDVNDDADDDTGETFPPEDQDPFFEKGLILPPNSLECVPVDTGVPQMNCNHHGSVVAVLPDGTIASVWYHGEREKSPDSWLVWSRLAPGETEWTWPEVLFDDPGRAEGNPAIWVREDGVLYVFFVTIFGDGWNQSRVRMVTSEDGGDTWSGDTMLRDNYCWMVRNEPVRLKNGELLLPLYNECLAYPVYMRSTDDFATWSEEAHFNLGYYLGHAGQIQPSLIVLDDGTVTAVTRDGTPFNRVMRTTSDDGGLTWSPSKFTALPNSGTSIDQVLLLDGHVVVVYNDSPDRRFPLSVALSLDGGETFASTVDINNECDGENCSYHYPSIAQSPFDGTIWVTYTHQRETIGWAHFNEAWIIDNGEEIR